MKGFLYLVEIAVAAILAAIVLGSFFSAQAVTTNWNRADLVGIGNNMFDTMGTDAVKVLNETAANDNLKTLKPSNVRYALKFSGIPKSNIIVGSNDPGYVGTVLTNAYLNNRFITFEVHHFGTGDSLDDFDIVVLHSYGDYTDQRLVEFSKEKTVIGIEDESTNAAFRNFYGLTGVSGVTPTTLTFLNYDSIAKYFFGIGYIIETPYTAGDGNKYGSWSIRSTTPRVEISGTKVCVNTADCDPVTNERGLITWDGVNYLVKKIDFANEKVYFGTKETTFNFPADFSDASLKATGTNIIGNAQYSAMTRNGNRIWIAKFPDRSEYHTLVKAAAASSVTEWMDSESELTDVIEVSRFVPLCCDIPEVAQMSFILWYVF